jgi:prephenate dehydrogenase
MSANKKITILGGGLLGGSLALAAADFYTVKLWARRYQTVDAAKNLGIDATVDLSIAVKNADLVVLCVPVGAMAQLTKDAISVGLPKTALITDVGSVKRKVHEDLEGVVAESGNVFIGSHPMAGSEQGGIEMAKKDLFQNAACIFTKEKISSEVKDLNNNEIIKSFWINVGCKTPMFFSPIDHDNMVARISHFPHVIAATCAVVAESNNYLGGDFAGGGLRDTTRIAGGNPEMWAEILYENRGALKAPIKEAIAEMEVILRLLENEDQSQKNIEEWLIKGRTAHDILQACWSSPSLF